MCIVNKHTSGKVLHVLQKAFLVLFKVKVPLVAGAIQILGEQETKIPHACSSLSDTINRIHVLFTVTVFS